MNNESNVILIIWQIKGEDGVWYITCRGEAGGCLFIVPVHFSSAKSVESFFLIIQLSPLNVCLPVGVVSCAVTPPTSRRTRGCFWRFGWKRRWCKIFPYGLLTRQISILLNISNSNVGSIQCHVAPKLSISKLITNTLREIFFFFL